MSSLFFRQLFDKESSTYTYIIADPKSKKALIIDPVLDQIDRDLLILNELHFTLEYIFDTHVHADHITGSGLMRKKTGAKIIMSKNAWVSMDIGADDNDRISLGGKEFTIILTPGHTAGCASLIIENMVFTGDTLLIRKTGRTDFQWGSSDSLYGSIVNKIYALPDDTIIYPWHDYIGQSASSVWEEKKYNERIPSGTSKESFIQTMSKLKLDYPKHIDKALPANKLLWIIS